MLCQVPVESILVNINQNCIQKETQSDLELAYQRSQQFSLDWLAGEEQKNGLTVGLVVFSRALGSNGSTQDAAHVQCRTNRTP